MDGKPKRDAGLEDTLVQMRANLILTLTLTLTPLACSFQGGGGSEVQGDAQEMMKALTKTVMITLATDEDGAARQRAKETETQG